MLDEAIEVLKLENKHPWNRDNSKLRKSVQLGIEALERITFLKGKSLNYIQLSGILNKPLPSETDE